MIQRLQSLTLNQGSWLISITILVICGFVLASRLHYPLRPVFYAQPYEWPKGCPKLDYGSRTSRGDLDISCACADPEYRIKDQIERGLGRSVILPIDYYRVDADAVQIERIGPRSEKRCRVRKIQHDFFQLDGNTSYQNAITEANRE